MNTNIALGVKNPTIDLSAIDARRQQFESRKLAQEQARNQIAMQPVVAETQKLQLANLKLKAMGDLLYGVNDQATYDAAKKKGFMTGVIDRNTLDQLPVEYDAPTIESFQNNVANGLQKLQMAKTMADIQLSQAHADYYKQGGSRRVDAGGGATGALVRQYMQATGSDFPTALYAVQTGFRQGFERNADGSISPIPGAVGAIKDVNYAKHYSAKTGDLDAGHDDLLKQMEATYPELEDAVGE